MEDKYNIIVTEMEETVSKKVGFENKEIINEKIIIIEKQETFESEMHEDSYQITNSKIITSEPFRLATFNALLVISIGCCLSTIGKLKILFVSASSFNCS